MIDPMALSGVGGPTSPQRQRLSAEQLAQVAKLAARDREVRAHEAAHMAAAGDLAVGGPQFTYQTGPDGKLYAVGGEVKISLTPGHTPEETLAKAERMRQAATAPNDPSGQDMNVAARAGLMEQQARDQQTQPGESDGTIRSAAHLRAYEAQ